MATFVADLRNLSDDCNFRESLEDMLRGRLVCGINNYQIQRRLWAETKLKYQKAVELAFAIERARKIWVICQKQMQIHGKRTEQVDKVTHWKQVSMWKKNQYCDRYARKQERSSWKFKVAKCYKSYR